MALRDNSDNIPPAPLRYQIFKWRREMSMSWQDAMQTPVHVFMQDLHIMSMEAQYLRKKEGDK